MTEFYFVRHGKTQFNLERRFQGGQCDSPLLSESLRDAKKVGDYFKAQGQNFDAWYTSPQKRAWQTGKVIVDQLTQDLVAQPLDGLREIEFGTWDGQKLADFAGTADLKNYLEKPSQYDPAANGGESYPEFLARANAALAEIYQQHPQGKVLISAHAVLISFLTKSKIGINLDAVRPAGLVANTSVTVLKTDNFENFTMPVWNLTDFLK